MKKFFILERGPKIFCVFQIPKNPFPRGGLSLDEMDMCHLSLKQERMILYS